MPVLLAIYSVIDSELGNTEHLWTKLSRLLGIFEVSCEEDLDKVLNNW